MKNGIQRKMMSSSVTMMISRISAQIVMIGIESEQIMPRLTPSALQGLLPAPSRSLCSGQGSTEQDQIAEREPLDALHLAAQHVGHHERGVLVELAQAGRRRCRAAGAMRIGRAGASGSKKPASWNDRCRLADHGGRERPAVAAARRRSGSRTSRDRRRRIIGRRRAAAAAGSAAVGHRSGSAASMHERLERRTESGPSTLRWVHRARRRRRIGAAAHRSGRTIAERERRTDGHAGRCLRCTAVVTASSTARRGANRRQRSERMASRAVPSSGDEVVPVIALTSADVLRRQRRLRRALDRGPDVRQVRLEKPGEVEQDVPGDRLDPVRVRLSARSRARPGWRRRRSSVTSSQRVSHGGRRARGICFHGAITCFCSSCAGR